MLLLAELRIPDRTGNSPRGKQIYRQSWKRWKMHFCVGCRTKGSCMLEADQKFEVIFGSDMRPLFAILGLLLCFIATRSDELPVIKDWEAIHYVGKNVEVRGFVVSGFPDQIPITSL
jgi:hypothetical protein